jgi:hypothetical protein
MFNLNWIYDRNWQDNGDSIQELGNVPGFPERFMPGSRALYYDSNPCIQQFYVKWCWKVKEDALKGRLPQLTASVTNATKKKPNMKKLKIKLYSCLFKSMARVPSKQHNTRSQWPVFHYFSFSIESVIAFRFIYWKLKLIFAELLTIQKPHYVGPQPLLLAKVREDYRTEIHITVTFQ